MAMLDKYIHTWHFTSDRRNNSWNIFEQIVRMFAWRIILSWGIPATFWETGAHLRIRKSLSYVLNKNIPDIWTRKSTWPTHFIRERDTKWKPPCSNHADGLAMTMTSAGKVISRQFDQLLETKTFSLPLLEHKYTPLRPSRFLFLSYCNAYRYFF